MKRFVLALLLLAAWVPGFAAISQYEVKQGDTLVAVLRALGYGETYAELLPFIGQVVEMNADALRAGNGDVLYPGSVLALPPNPNAPEPEPEPQPEPVPEPEPEPEPVIPSIGSVEVSSGAAEILRENQAIAVSQREVLYAHDVIVTRKASVAEIILADDTRISVGPNSEFVITEYAYVKPQSAGGNALGRLVASIRNGVIRSVTGLLGRLKSNRFEINSALTATIGIRGTDFTVRTCTQVELCGDLYGVAVAVQDGGISFKNAAAEIDLAQNEFAQVQSATDAPAKAPLPDGFFDLQLDVRDIKVDRSWWRDSVDFFRSLFE